MKPREISKIEKICEKAIGVNADEMQVQLIHFNLTSYAIINITNHHEIIHVANFDKNIDLSDYLERLKIINQVFVNKFQINLKTRFELYLVTKKEQVLLKKCNLFKVMTFAEKIDMRDILFNCKKKNDEFVNFKITDNNKYNLLFDRKITYFV